MSRLKKILLTGISYVLVAALAIGGTFAYLQDEDSTVNVMTLGNVTIEQNEYQRATNEDGSYKTDTIDGVTSYVLEDFEQNKPLYPATEVDANGEPYNFGAGNWDTTWVRMSQVGSHGGMQVFESPLAVDKFVTVKNTGKSDAYVRTLIAYEIGSKTADEWGKLVRRSVFMSDEDVWLIEDIGIVDIEGNNYYIVEFVYNGAKHVGGVHENGVLPAGDTTYPSLCQVYMTAAATNEDVEALDGNNNGTYDIIVISQAVQTAGFENADDAFENSRASSVFSAAKIALDAAFGAPEAVNEEGNINAAEWLGGTMVAYEESLKPAVDVWDGTVVDSWYNDTDTEFTLTTAEQLAGLAKLVDGGNTFAGKTVKLGIDMDLNNIIFEPIGDASNADFSGVFDGNNHTIFNLRQDCNSKYLGLFGAVYEGAVKNLVLDGALIENDGTGYAAGIASYAGASAFENITLKNSTVVNYNHNTGGIVAWCSNNGTTTTFDGINIENTTTIGSWWGSPDTRVGGIVGAMNTGNYVVIKNSKVACRLDVYNDVVANYQWWNYRMAGMVIGDVRDSQTVGGRTEAHPARVTCENVEVIFGDWANYHYCEDSDFGAGSYNGAGEYKYKRVEAGLGYGGIDLSACDHADDETHNLLITFDSLFGARDGKGIYSINSFNGVTVTMNN